MPRSAVLLRSLQALRWARLSIVLLAAASACQSGSATQVAPTASGPIPASFSECVRAGGELEARKRGGRCFLRFPKRRDPSAYLHCRDAGGLPRAAGPAGPTNLSGDSHVCTLVFAPDT